MDLTVLGSGTSVPQKRRSAPGYLVRAGLGVMLLDLGPGTIWNLARLAGIGPGEVQGVFLSHLHIDHCSDLTSLLFSLRSPYVQRDDPLRVLGPAGLHGYYASLKGLYGQWVEPSGYDLLLGEWDGQPVEWGGFWLNAVSTIHSIPNIACLVQDRASGSRMIYTGDGEGTDELIELAQPGIDVLLAECSLGPGSRGENHMNPSQAGILAARCRAKKLVLTHLNPDCFPDEICEHASGYFAGEIVIAYDGLTVSF